MAGPGRRALVAALALVHSDQQVVEVLAWVSQVYWTVGQQVQAMADALVPVVVDATEWPVYARYYALPCRQLSGLHGWYLPGLDQ